MIIDPFWERLDATLPPEHKTRPSAILGEATDHCGIFRFLVALLASINELPRRITAAPTRTGARQVGMHALPYLRHSTITIDLPREDRIQWARNRLSQEARKRPWHRVRGHWRIIEYGALQGRYCRHQPTMIEGDLAMCAKCEMLIRFIASHTRGDPSVGIVEHTYLIAGPANAGESSGPIH